MTQTKEPRDREAVEQELQRATQARDKARHELNEVRGQLEVARQEEAAGISEAVRSGRSPKSASSVGKLESKAGELERTLSTLNQLVNRLDFERRELLLEELDAEVTRLAQRAAEARERKREATEEATRAGNEVVAVRQERDDVKRSLSRKIPRSADRQSVFIRT